MLVIMALALLPVGYYSKHLTDAEQRYATSEKELMAIIKLQVLPIRVAGGTDEEETIAFLQYRENNYHYPALYYFNNLNIRFYGKGYG